MARNDDYVLLAADYSQIELRIIASLANDRHMIEAFANHYDIHAATAAKIYKIPIEEVSKDLRRNAKSVNFGIVYGISAFGLSEQLGIARKEAAALIDEYFTQYPDIKKYIDTNIAFAHVCRTQCCQYAHSGHLGRHDKDCYDTHLPTVPRAWFEIEDDIASTRRVGFRLL